MSLLPLLLLIFVAGAVGGAINALLSENGFLMPKQEMVGENKIIRLGFLGNIFISSIGACVSWGLYGPFSGTNIFGSPSEKLDLSLSALVGAVLVGVAGARWVTNEVDKLLLRAVASEAAKIQPSHDVASQIAQAKPAQAVQIFQKRAETSIRGLSKKAKVALDKVKAQGRKSLEKASARAWAVEGNGKMSAAQ